MDEKKIQLVTKEQDDINFKKYTDSMTRLVEEYKQKYPEKYKLAQLTGESVMTSDYNVVNGYDKYGNNELLEQMIQTIKYFDLKPEDLTRDDIIALKRTGKYEEIFKN